MIFNKIFNLLRYNNTTPSYLIKNKFFLERTNKFKNIRSTLNNMYKTYNWSFNQSINIDNNYNFKLIIKLITTILVLSLLTEVNYLSMILNHLEFTIWKSCDLFFMILNGFLMYFIITFKIIWTKSYNFYINNKFILVSQNKLTHKINTYNADKTLATSADYRIVNKDDANRFIKLYKFLWLNTNNTKPIKHWWTGFNRNYVLKNTNNSLVIYKNNFQNTLLITSDNKNYNFFKNTNKNSVNYLKNLEYYKWLYKYSTVHSRSLAEAGHLAKKITTITNKNLTNKNLTNINTLNYYFKSPELQKNLLNLSNILNFESQKNLNPSSSNVLINNNVWLKSFSELNLNFKWFFFKYMSTNEVNFKLINLRTSVTEFNKFGPQKSNQNLNNKPRVKKQIFTQFINNVLYYKFLINNSNSNFFVKNTNYKLVTNKINFKNDLTKFILLSDVKKFKQ